MDWHGALSTQPIRDNTAVMSSVKEAGKAAMRGVEPANDLHFTSISLTRFKGFRSNQELDSLRHIGSIPVRRTRTYSVTEGSIPFAPT